MSSKRNLIETIIFCFVWIALFIVSFVAIYISGNEHTTNDLKSSIKIAQYIFNGNNPEETGQEVADAFVDSGVRISIIQKSSDDYSILYDSKDLLAPSKYILSSSNTFFICSIIGFTTFTLYVISSYK